jgi:anaerobic ribonucleoside-triphosphate reductase
LKWNFFNIKIGFNSDDKYQRVCKYLLALQNKDTYDIRKLVKESKPMPIQECQGIIQNHITSTLKNPNFYYINSFVTFVDEQLTLLEKST